MQHRYGYLMAVLTAAALLGDGLRAEQQYFVPALDNIQPVGSNPKANRMTKAEFETYTADWRARYAKSIENYAPDYAGSEALLGPPAVGRLKSPLPLARAGQARAEIIADVSPERHTPEATLGRKDYPPEVAIMRHTGHLVVKNAVDELKYWLDTLTGAEFPVSSEPSDGERTRIFVGADFARAHFADDIERLGEGDNLDGFAVRTRGGDIYIFGATAKGTMNGVFTFIENNSDLIWAYIDYTSLPRRDPGLGTVYTVNPNLDAVWGDALEKPGTVQRGWLGRYQAHHGNPGIDPRHGKPRENFMWWMRNRNNFIFSSRHAPQLAQWGCWRQAGGHMLGTFVAGNIEEPKRFYPWIPDQEGELKQPDKIQHYQHNICMTHPDLPEPYADAIVDKFRGWRESAPQAPLNAVMVSQEDPHAGINYGLCMCERCQRPVKLPDGRIIPVQSAVEEGLEFRTTQYYLLLEYIARALVKEFPDARLATYAYYFGAEPPPFQTIVQPWLCPYGKGKDSAPGILSIRAYNLPLFAEYNNRWWEYAYGWSRITDLTAMYEYYGLVGNGRPFAQILAWDLRGLLPMGVKRFTSEIGRHIMAPFIQMDVWVANRLYWDPDADVEALTAYYLRRTFREGAPAMAAFFETIHEWWYARHDTPEQLVQLGWIVERMGEQRKLHGYLREALAQARHPVARANVARLLTTFESWFPSMDLEAVTAREMLENAKLGRHVPFSLFMHDDRPLPVTYVTFPKPEAKESEALIADVAPGKPGDGWVEGWQYHGNGRAEVTDANPLNKGGNYLVSSGDRSTARYSHQKLRVRQGVSRRREDVHGDLDFDRPHTLAFDFRVDSLPEAWATSSGVRVEMFDSVHRAVGPVSHLSWGGIAYGGPDRGNWEFVDRKGTADKAWASRDTGVALEAGVVYSFEITLYPGTTGPDYDPAVGPTYDLTIRHPGGTHTAKGLGMRNYEGPGAYLNWSIKGGESKFSLDSIRIASVAGAKSEMIDNFDDGNRNEQNAITRDFDNWTFRMRIRPVGATAENAFPVPLLSLGSAKADGDKEAASPWLPPVAPEQQKDGGYLYTVPLRGVKGSAFKPQDFKKIRLEYPAKQWRDPEGYTPEFAVYDMQLSDPEGNRFADPTLPARLGETPLRRWQ
jgi:hypothetical protein